uniref:Uncharacterized protein n=1 Tax=Anopheles farauti TaxID=69004 RepID=A0A182QLL1_9DIPT
MYLPAFRLLQAMGSARILERPSSTLSLLETTHDVYIHDYPWSRFVSSPLGVITCWNSCNVGLAVSGWPVEVDTVPPFETPLVVVVVVVVVVVDVALPLVSIILGPVAVCSAPWVVGAMAIAVACGSPVSTAGSTLPSFMVANGAVLVTARAVGVAATAPAAVVAVVAIVFFAWKASATACITWSWWLTGTLRTVVSSSTLPVCWASCCCASWRMYCRSSLVAVVEVAGVAVLAVPAVPSCSAPSSDFAPSNSFLISSRGTMSMRKSNWSYLVIAIAMSLRCSVRRLLCSVCCQARSVSSWMKISIAFANSSGASDEIIFTSSSSFMIFLMRASGRS